MVGPGGAGTEEGAEALLAVKDFTSCVSKTSSLVDLSSKRQSLLDSDCSSSGAALFLEGSILEKGDGERRNQARTMTARADSKCT